MDKAVVVGIVIVIIVIAGGAGYLLLGKPKTSTSSSTSIPTSTVQSSNISSLESLDGQNLSFAQFSHDIDAMTFNKINMLNVTYNYNSSTVICTNIACPNSSTYTTGTIGVQKYYNDTRVDEAINYTGPYPGNSTSTFIFNSSAHETYICNTYTNGTYFCDRSSDPNSSYTNEFIINFTGLNFLGNPPGPLVSSSYKSYYNNIKVSNSNYEGQSCTLITGHIYYHYIETSPIKGWSPNNTINGTFSTCISSQYHIWLNQSLIGTSVEINNGQLLYNSNTYYNERERSITTLTSQSIVIPPGPVT